MDKGRIVVTAACMKTLCDWTEGEEERKKRFCVAVVQCVCVYRVPECSVTVSRG